MKKIITLILFIAHLTQFTACTLKENGSMKQVNDAMKRLLSGIRAESLDKDDISWQLYNYITRLEPDEVKRILEKGANPNFCKGDGGWYDSNPLNVLVRTFYNTYNDDKMAKNPRDVFVLDLLVKAGADINRRPYVWELVHLRDTPGFYRVILANEDEQTTLQRLTHHVVDVNRLLKAFLDAGANPDKLGHPYPFSYEALMQGMDDEQANGFFAQGTRAINEAIKKGMVWESQVDLLLQYTSLDEGSLNAAERSNDPAMIEKITKLWENQQAER
jgi:hypothetical protein